MAPEPEGRPISRFSIRSGMAVANTYTLEGSYGSHVVVQGTGILLNNEMGDFNKKPGQTDSDRQHRHGAEPDRAGERMLSSMARTIVTKNGKLVLVTGSPGGRTIIHRAQHRAEHGRLGYERPRCRRSKTPGSRMDAGPADDRRAASRPRSRPRSKPRATGTRAGAPGTAQTIRRSWTGQAFGIADMRDSTAKASSPVK